MRRWWSHLVLGLSLLAVLGQWVSPAVDAAAEPAAAALSRQLRLTVDAPITPLALGDEAALTIVVANNGAETVENVRLYLPQERGVEWLEPAGVTWLEMGALAVGESRTVAARVRVAAMPRSSYLRFFVGATGDEAKPQHERVDLLVPRADAETATAPAAGGEVAFAHGRVRLVFPPGWNEQDAQVTFQLEELYKHKDRERGRLLLFTIEAMAGGAPVESFDARVAVTLALGDLRAPDEDESIPAVTTAPTTDENWTTIESTFDPAAGTLDFTTTELAAVQAATDPELWRLDYNPPGASAYSGAATYSYPIELPPGVGGLTPDLALSYSSRAAEGLTYPAMSQGFGAGWGLPQAQINNGSSGRMYNDDLGGSQGNTDFDKNAFTLVLNGMNYYMNPLDTTGRYGTYKAIGSPELYISYVADSSIPNVSGEYWLVRTADGTTYTFGRTEDAEQVIWPVEEARNASQPRNPRFSPYNWKLNSIVDVHGNRIEYVYETACGKIAGGSKDRGQYRQDAGHTSDFECSEVDTAVSEIRYNFDGGVAKTVIRFTNDQVNDAVRSQKLSMTAGVFRPAQIKVIQNGNVTTPISTYTFFYTGGGHGFEPWLVSTQFWMLTHIYHSGSDGTTLPAQQFSYSRDFTHGCSDDGSSCVKLLTEVDNGYGGVTVLGYQTYRDWAVVQYTETWDGVVHRRGTDGKGQTRVEYDHAGATACFDSADSACHMGTQHPTEALVGFNQATITTLGRNGANWATLNKTALTFYNNDYWLLGRTQYEKQYESDGKQLAQAQYEWKQLSGFVYLEWEAHALFDATNGQTSVGSTTVYTYYPVDPAQNQFGGLKQKLEKDEAGAVYRCTEYAYASRTDGTTWLINRPARETVWSGGCAGTPVAETLYRYADSNKPAVVGLDGRARLTYVLRWLKQGNNDRYVVEKHTYTSQGLSEMVATFDNVLALDAANYSDLVTRNTTTTTYTSVGLPQFITTEADGLTSQTQMLEYEATRPWLVVSAADANNITTRYAYDAFGRLTKVASPGETLDAPTATTTYSDGIAPWKIETKYKATIRSTERQFYDGLGRLVQAQTDNVAVEGQTGEKDIVTTVAYDARGLEVCRTVPYAVGGASNAFQVAACGTKANTATAYDGLGRAISVTAPDGTTTRTTYEVATNVTVDGHSRLALALAYDGNNHLTGHFSDVFGRQVLVREYTGSGPYSAYADTRYSYSVLDELLSVTTSEASNNQSKPVLRQTSMDYDELGRKVSMSDADMGQWGYNYNDAGNLDWQQDAAGQVICFYYDKLNRLVRRAANGASTNCPAYNSSPASGANHLASYTYDLPPLAPNIGRLTAVSWGPNPAINKDTFAYDGEGRVQEQIRTINDQPFKLGSLTAPVAPITYDTLDRPLSVRYPDGQTLVYTYDQEGVDTLTYNNQPILSGLGYTALGQPAKVNRAGTMVDTTYAYYGAGENFRLQSIQSGPQSVMPAFFYTAYDNAGNLTGQTIWGDVYTYAYDEMNRLTSVRGGLSQDYSYDRLGNFDTATKWGETWDYSYWNGTSRVKAVSGLDFGPPANETGAVYDARGNLTKYKQEDVTTSLSYDVEGRLTSVTSAGQTTQFFYDADGQRVLTVLPGDNPTQIYTPFPDYEKEVPGGANPTVTQRVTFSANGRAMAQWVKVGATATLYALYTDHLGSVVAVGTAGGGLVANSYATYQPFGAFVSNPTGTNPSVTDRGFTGHKHNNTGTNNLGLIYMNARYYHPQLGRFVSPDTIVPDPGNPQSYNRYSYARNSPMNFTDPTGHRECASSASCADPLVHEIQVSLVLFSGDGWTDAEKVRVEYGAYRVAEMLYRESGLYVSPRRAFLAVYHGAVTFHKTGVTAGNLGEATGRNMILVNNLADGGITSPGAGAMWAAHEMGHAFNYALLPNGVDDLSYGAGLVNLALEGVFVDSQRIAGNTTSSYANNATYIQTSSGYRLSPDGKAAPYRQNTVTSASEDFADMFMNYVFGSFADNAYGAARFDFMDSHMSTWISLATSTGP